MANVVREVAEATPSVSVLASAARTATPDTEELELRWVRALHLVIDVTAITLTPSLTVTISGVDRLSGKVYTLLASAAITAVGTTVLKVGQGLTAAANLVANDMLPPIVRITCTHGDADSITYSVAALLAD